MPKNVIEWFEEVEEVEDIEKPNRIDCSMTQGIIASCILPITLRPPYLSGEGVLVAIIDSGIDYTHDDFRNEDGTTRIVRLWDQTIAPNEELGYIPPVGFSVGAEFDSNRINEALSAATRAEQDIILPTKDITGHGTAVAGIAAGNGRASDGQYIGVAPKGELVIVKLGSIQPEGFPKTTELMRALAYVTYVALSLNKPIAINLSFGNTYGNHDGTSLLERYVDNVSEIGKTVICVGSGNEAASAGHASGKLENLENSNVELSIAPYEITTSVQLWKNYNDNFNLLITSPNGESILLHLTKSGTVRATLEDTELLIYIGEPTPYSVNQEIFIDMLPKNDYITKGLWTFTLMPIKIISGFYRFYLPSAVTRNSSTRFYKPDPNATFTIPSTAAKVITLGA